MASALAGMSSSRIIFAAGPLMAWPPTMGDTATMGAPQCFSAARTPGRFRIGSTLTNGLDGQMTMASTLRLSSMCIMPACGRALSMPSKRKPVTAGWHCSRTK